MSKSPADGFCLKVTGMDYASLCVKLNISNHFNITDHAWVAAHAIEEFKYKEMKKAADRDRELAELLQNQCVIDSGRSRRSDNPYPIRNWFSTSTTQTTLAPAARRYNLRSKINQVVSATRNR